MFRILIKMFRLLFGKRDKLINTYKTKHSMFKGKVINKEFQRSNGSKYVVSYGILRRGIKTIRKNGLEFPNYIDGCSWHRQSGTKTMFKQVRSI